jgi:PAS domain S-box-containing protein
VSQGTATDIKDLKQAQAMLRESEARLAVVIDTIPAFVWSTLPDGSFDFVNQRYLEYTGLGPEEALGWACRDIVHPDDYAHQKEDWSERFARGEAVEYEVRLRRFDGVYRWFLNRAAPFLDDSGNVVKWYGTSTDIEDRKQAESASRRREAYLAEAQRLTHVGGWALRGCALDPAEYWSTEAFELFGLDPSLGPPSFQELLECVHPDDRDRLERERNEVVTTGGAFEAQFRAVHPSGEIRVLRAVGKPFFEGGEAVGYIGAWVDVTEHEKMTEELRRQVKEIETLREQLYRENIALREQVDQASMFEEIVGTSRALQAVLSKVAKVAPTDSTVLITGETGTGKELIARAIHKRSTRAERAFVSVNCAAIPPSLIASELFGHEKGAFTGALQRRLGRFELAESGTIFLDEVGELPPETQIALLRVLQEREFERVGGNHVLKADVRVIAASNRDLKAASATGEFRSDLFYRLNVFPIHLPPLRERQEDIPVLVEYFIDRYATKAGKKISSIDARSLEQLQAYGWPGNVRELQNVIERSLILGESEVFSVDESWLSAVPAEPPATEHLRKKLAVHEKEILESALAVSRGRVYGPSGAAAKLGLPPSTLESRIKVLKIKKHRFKE